MSLETEKVWVDTSEAHKKNYRLLHPCENKAGKLHMPALPQPFLFFFFFNIPHLGEGIKF